MALAEAGQGQKAETGVPLIAKFLPLSDDGARRHTFVTSRDWHAQCTVQSGATWMFRFRDRVDAGRHLARQLSAYASRSDVIVLGLPRGGVPVAAEVARALGAPLDVFLVRKLGVPGHPELAMGAIAEGGIRVLSTSLIRQLDIPTAAVDQIAARERLELDRRDVMYRGGRPAPPLAGRTVILVDDGLATGASMEAAIAALREHKPADIVVAAPVGSRETCARLAKVADRVVCAEVPDDFAAVGQWYADFNQTSDDEVIRVLADAGRAMPRSPRAGHPDLVDVVRLRARQGRGSSADFDAIVAAAGEAAVVLIGEATHGTHEFYRDRALITQRLIVEKGFSAVAVEADWPDAYRVNRFVRRQGDDRDAVAALGDFKRFPTWMWRNADVVDFVSWLRAENDRRAAGERVGFYGLDLYSLHASMTAVIAFLDKVDPAAAARARDRYACFDRFGEEMDQYATATGMGWEPGCEREVMRQLVDLRKRAGEYARRDGRLAADDVFFAEQNARLVASAEEYYRTVFAGRVESWNLRDRHMAETLEELRQYLEQSHRPPRVVVWAHNSHVGDARATEMARQGELNIGQLARERHGARALCVGLTTYTGTVTAARDWGARAERRQVRRALNGSWEHVFHDAGLRRAVLDTRADIDLASALRRERLERAIGVLYLPDSERRSHYFQARPAEQFDYVIHIDETRAVEPLERTQSWDAGELAETYPTGL